MKYMHFNMSCPYAALANLLEEHGTDVEDFDIVKAIHLPYIFQYDLEQKAYIAGPLLQGKKWFNYYLNPLGMTFIEEFFDKKNLLTFLDSTNSKCMIGLNLQNRHAVIYEGKEGSKYKFLNNKRKEENSPNQYLFSKEELLAVLNPQSAVGYIIPQDKQFYLDTTQEILLSLHYLEQYQKELYIFCHEEQTPHILKATMDSLFAASLLHIPSMMQLIGETELANEFCEIRNQYMNAIRQSQSLKLIDYIQYFRFENALNNYKNLIKKQT